MADRAIAITASALARLFKGETVTFADPEGRIKVVLAPEVLEADVLAAVEEGRAFLATTRVPQADFSAASVQTLRPGITEEQAEAARLNREVLTGFAHVKWQDGGRWSVGPELPPRRLS